LPEDDSMAAATAVPGADRAGGKGDEVGVSVAAALGEIEGQADGEAGIRAVGRSGAELGPEYCEGSVGESVAMPGALDVGAARVGVGALRRVGVRAGRGVALAARARVGVRVGVAVAKAATVAEGEAVGVAVAEAVGVAVPVGGAVAVEVAVPVEVAVAVGWPASTATGPQKWFAPPTEMSSNL
jgi:hypothetical protein